MTADDVIKALDEAMYWAKRKKFVDGKGDYFDSPLTILTQKYKIVVEKSEDVSTTSS